MHSFSRAAVGALVLASAAGFATAQSAAPAPASGYGTQDLQVVNVTFDRFEPLGSGSATPATVASRVSPANGGSPARAAASSSP